MVLKRNLPPRLRNLSDPNFSVSIILQKVMKKDFVLPHLKTESSEKR